MDGVVSSLPPVVFPQRFLQRWQTFDFTMRKAPGRLSGQFCHDLRDIFELSFRAPSSVLAPPLRPWPEPDSKGFGKIFGRMCLGIPGVKIENVIAAAGLRLIPFGI